MSPDPHQALLALHTTEPEGSVAVGTQSGCRELPIVTGGPQAPALLEAVLALLTGAGMDFGGLTGIVVSTGPGSFTGIRVGLATAQGLAAARGWRVYACDSLLARAALWSPHREPVAVVLDARRGEVYAALYDVRSFPPRVVVEPFCAVPDAASARLPAGAAQMCDAAAEAAPLVLTGSGAAMVGARLPAAAVLGAAPRTVAAALLDLAWGGACVLAEPQTVEPTYLRKSDAEVHRESPVPRGS
jgi:tRNA threonylcarbamoyladenosine biosynthesis protein TsaB